MSPTKDGPGVTFLSQIVPLHIQAPRDVEGQPVTLGVPLPRGSLRDPAMLRLLDSESNPVPLQTTALSHWPDGSIKWVLLDFLIRSLRAGRRSYGSRS